jgi:hypothetical protein
MAKSNRIILIDADVVSHFISGGLILKLPIIFSASIKILDKVYSELSNFKSKKKHVDNLVNYKLIEVIPFPEDNAVIKKEYHHIKKLLFKGDGEAACLAFVRHTNDIIASSNLKDIKSYCIMHKIDYLTTMDFLCEALNKSILTEVECDEFITNVLKAGSKLPVKNMKSYTCRDLAI